MKVPWTVAQYGQDGSPPHFAVKRCGLTMAAGISYEEDARLMAAAPDLLKALESLELRLCQTRLASSIGKKSMAKRVDFLLNCIDAIEKDARAAINKAKGGA